MNLPGSGPRAPADYEAVALIVQEDGAVLWNVGAVSRGELGTCLSAPAAQAEVPPIRFAPEANAGYQASVNVINAVADARRDKFPFVDNEQCREFGVD